jgi:hypothetical protein
MRCRPNPPVLSGLQAVSWPIRWRWFPVHRCEVMEMRVSVQGPLGIVLAFQAVSGQDQPVRERVRIGVVRAVRSSEAVVFDPTVETWTLRVPVTWSVNTTRLIVTVVEEATGARGVAIVEPPGD